MRTNRRRAFSCSTPGWPEPRKRPQWCNIGRKETVIASNVPVPARLLHEPPYIAPLAVSQERLTHLTVCTRPFRAAGPRVEAERVGEKLVVHNYGHGGSGWSLSWGSAAVVVALALVPQAREIAVLGCGALGLTTAIALQRAGARVAIYAKDAPAATRSSRATGAWTPDSRVALAADANEAFVARWEAMARTSFAAYKELLHLPGRPIEFHDRYTLSELQPDAAFADKERRDPVGFARLEHRLADLSPAPIDFGPGEHPFPAAWCRKTQLFRFNITNYTRVLEQEFRERGGVLREMELRTVQEVLALPQQTVINCTGYGARALFGDASLTPVRGQIAWLPPEPSLPYSLVDGDLNVVPRGDGTVLQWGAQGDGTGWNDASEAPDHAEARSAVQQAALLYAGIRRS